MKAENGKAEGRARPDVRPFFHVVNGDATLALLKGTSLPGGFAVWPDILMEGPLPRRKDGSLDWTERAAFLSSPDGYGVARRTAAARIRAFNESLEAASRGKAEAVFWFEEDFFCQIHLVYLLATLPPAFRRPGRASVICPARPLGGMSPRALERLFADREPLAAERQALSRKTWRALSVPAAGAGGGRSTGAWKAPRVLGDAGSARQYGPSGSIGPTGPTGQEGRASLGRLASWVETEEEFSCWPLLRRGLRAYIHARSGGLEGVLLRVLGKAPGGKAMAFPELFRRVAGHPRLRPLGLGDAQVARQALRLASGPGAPIRISSPAEAIGPGDLSGCRAWRLARALHSR